MKISEAAAKMIARCAGSQHDIGHFLKVWAYARTIGELEQLDAETQFILEAAAITHDIACPLCREKYGSTAGKYQETEGVPLVGEFLADTGMTEEQIERVKYLVGHHHTFSAIDGIDWQILIEADYIANASENGWGAENVKAFMDRIAKTDTGKQLMKDIFLIPGAETKSPGTADT